MSIDISAFRAIFPEFADAAKFPDVMISMWSVTATAHIKKGYSMSGDVYSNVLSMMTAHLLFLAGRAASGSSTSGAVQSASEGSVSVSFAASPAKNGWEFWLSQSPYGQMLWALLCSLSAGGQYAGGAPEGDAVRRVYGVFM